ncbi:hypothetical protein IFM89_004390 [Coptis chinensis]|uniref:Uncharacterized protein n=1 Tax=Coptis chinensis TaxID=261450 RepID=A0A835I2Q7_9MAGN|nr:hypothetical protein IFM89_004390 [Coptis chinensis]
MTPSSNLIHCFPRFQLIYFVVTIRR